MILFQNYVLKLMLADRDIQKYETRLKDEALSFLGGMNLYFCCH